MTKSPTRNGYCDIWRIKILSGGAVRVAIHQPEAQVESATLESECPAFTFEEPK
jgi:hypothetical protein